MNSNIFHTVFPSVNKSTLYQRCNSMDLRRTKLKVLEVKRVSRAYTQAWPISVDLLNQRRIIQSFPKSPT